MKNVIVVGGGLAGLRTAMALRTQGYQGELTLVGAEHHRPYDRPPLTKAVLAGESDDTTLPADWERLRCGLRLGQRARALRFHDGRPGGVLETTAGPLDFDGLVIATGATPIRLPGHGPQHVVRTLEDARGLRASLRPGARVLIVGAGWIGAEVATAAAKKGCRVTVLEAAATPLATVLGPELGVLTVGWYAEAGVELRLGAEVASVDHGGVTLTDGRSVPADVVVAGVGARPEVGWLAGSGLDVQRGWWSTARYGPPGPRRWRWGTARPGGRSATAADCWSSTGRRPTRPPRRLLRHSSAGPRRTTLRCTSGPSSSGARCSTRATTRQRTRWSFAARPTAPAGRRCG